MNDHYTRDYNPPSGTRVSSSDLINEFQSVEVGFDSVQSGLSRTLRQTGGDAVAAMPSAASRALKALAFDASGNPIAVSMVLVTDAVARTGDTMLGPLILSADPVTALGAATKQYVDNKPTTPDFLLMNAGVI